LDSATFDYIVLHQGVVVTKRFSVMLRTMPADAEIAILADMRLLDSAAAS
jgi:hypothetical protein